MKKYFKIRNLFLLLFFIISSNSVFSCEFHEGYGHGGFMPGGYMPGRFTNRNSYSSDTIRRTPVSDSSRNWLTLTAPTMVSAKLNDKTDISIEYKTMTQIEDVRLTLEGIPEVSVVNKVQTETGSESGRYTFTIIATKSGTFKLTTIANAGENDSAKAIREVIYLNVKTSG